MFVTTCYKTCESGGEERETPQKQVNEKEIGKERGLERSREGVCEHEKET